jgi:Cys-rich protein (TIGR01571 family)
MSQPKVPDAPGTPLPTAVATPTTANSGSSFDKGWKSRLFDDCREDSGLCINSTCCSPCILAQTSARVKKYVFGKDFKSFLRIAICLYTAIIVWNIIYRIVLEVQVGNLTKAMLDPEITDYTENYTEISLFSTLWNIPFVCLVAVMVYIIWKTRINVREAKNIPGDSKQDLLLSLFCSICTVIQLAKEVDVDGKKCMNMEEPNESEIGFEKV